MTVFAPCSSAYRIVGSEARIRVSSLISPCLIGTLKSTRMSTRRPVTSRSVIVRFATLVSVPAQFLYKPFFTISLSRSTQRFE